MSSIRSILHFQDEMTNKKKESDDSTEKKNVNDKYSRIKQEKFAHNSIFNS